MSQTELYEHGVDCSNLDTVTPASVADFGSFYVVFPIRLQEAKRAEPIDQQAKSETLAGVTVSRLEPSTPCSFSSVLDTTLSFSAQTMISVLRPSTSSFGCGAPSDGMQDPSAASCQRRFSLGC